MDSAPVLQPAEPAAAGAVAQEAATATVLRPFELLDGDLISSKIFCHLAPKTLVRAGLVCAEWHGLADEEELWQNLHDKVATAFRLCALAVRLPLLSSEILPLPLPPPGVRVLPLVQLSRVAPLQVLVGRLKIHRLREGQLFHRTHFGAAAPTRDRQLRSCCGRPPCI